VARQVAQLILAALLALAAPLAGANDLRTPQTPWSSLSSEQRRILGPVAPDWERMPGYQQQRLMSAARQYPSLQPIQKERFDQRIRDWATMSSDQRKAARETFQGLRKLPPEKQHELRERWFERQQQQYPRSEPRQQYAPVEPRQQQYAPVEPRQQQYIPPEPRQYGPSDARAPRYGEPDRRYSEPDRRYSEPGRRQRGDEGPREGSSREGPRGR
jgi:hypothetical protein